MTAVHLQVPTQVNPERVVAELLRLRPVERIAVGVTVAALGGAIDVMLWDEGWVSGLGLFAVVLGVAGIGSGLLGIRHERFMRTEVARALGQWDELRRELEHARDARQGIGKALTRLGYRDHQVRSWIRERLGIDGPAAASGGDGETRSHSG